MLQETLKGSGRVLSEMSSNNDDPESVEKNNQHFRSVLSTTNADGYIQRTNRKPICIVQFQDYAVENIVEVLNFANSVDISVSVCGGGHTENSAAPDSVMIDLRQYNKVRFENDPEFGPVIVAQGGATLNDIANVAAENGCIVPLGTAPTVGCGGLVYGGVGHLSRLLGLSVNSIVKMNIVTPSTPSTGENHQPTLHCLTSSDVVTAATDDEAVPSVGGTVMVIDDKAVPSVGDTVTVVSFYGETTRTITGNIIQISKTGSVLLDNYGSWCTIDTVWKAIDAASEDDVAATLAKEDPTELLFQEAKLTVQHNLLYFAARGAAPALGIVVDLTLRATPSDHIAGLCGSSAGALPTLPTLPTPLTPPIPPTPPTPPIPPTPPTDSNHPNMLWEVRHQYYETASRAELTDLFTAYSNVSNTKSMQQNYSLSADLYIERTNRHQEDDRITACVSQFNPELFATTAIQNLKTLTDVSKPRTQAHHVVPYHKLYRHEAYLHSNVTAHLEREKEHSELSLDHPTQGWSVFARSMFVSALSLEMQQYLSYRMLHKAPTSWCTLHIQHGGRGGDSTQDTKMKCAGDVDSASNWQYSIVLSCWYNKEENEEACKQWVVDTFHHLLSTEDLSKDVVCIYPTDLTPREDVANGLICDAFYDEKTRKQLNDEKKKYDPEGRLNSCPIDYYDYL